MQTASFQYYWALSNRLPSNRTGVQILPMKEYFDDRTHGEGLWYKRLMKDYEILPKSDLPEGCTFGSRYTSLAMNPLLLLSWLKEELSGKGVKFIKKEIKSIEEARVVTGSRIIVNASGVGAKELASDKLVKPIRGQTMFVKTTFNELVMKEGSEYTYVIPRAASGGVIIGGIKSDRLDTEVDQDLKLDILERINRVTNGAFKETNVEAVTDIVGFRPGREGQDNFSLLHSFYWILVNLSKQGKY
jgi:D-amino-acid oxidase